VTALLMSRQCRISQKAFHENPPSNIRKDQIFALEGDFGLLLSLLHAKGLLSNYGISMFHSYMMSKVRSLV